MNTGEYGQPTKTSEFRTFYYKYAIVFFSESFDASVGPEQKKDNTDEDNVAEAALDDSGDEAKESMSKQENFDDQAAKDIDEVEIVEISNTKYYLIEDVDGRCRIHDVSSVPTIGARRRHLKTCIKNR